MSDPVVLPLTRCCWKMVARGQRRNVFVPCNLPCPEPDKGAEPRCSKHDAEAFARRADEASRRQRAVNQIVRRLPDILAAIPARHPLRARLAEWMRDGGIPLSTGDKPGTEER